MSHATLDSATDPLADLNIRDCYQCGKCSAGCPAAFAMDVLPSRLLRLVQEGNVEKAVRAESLWKCVSCMTCTARCPKSVDCAGVIDALRQMAFECGQAPAARRRTVIFQKVFLDNIRRNGRVRELELVGRFKLAVFFSDGNVRALMKDSLLAPKLMRRNKLHFGGSSVEDRGVVDRIFARCMDNASGTRRVPIDGGRGSVPDTL